MKSIIKQMKNIAWLSKPYWTHGKWYIIILSIISVIQITVDDVVYVRFPEIIINVLAKGSTFINIVIIAGTICGIALLNNIIPNVFHRYFMKKQEGINLKINRSIYEKAMQTDYKYVDMPEYYDNYAWAINEYVNQTNAARDFIIRLLQYIFSITVLTSIIATIGPWILIVEIVQMILHALINVKVNQNNIKETEELVPINRRLDYFHRLFYLKEYAADIKSTPISKYAFNGYDQAGKSKLDKVSYFASKTAFWGSLHEVLFYLTEFIIILYLTYSIINGSIIEIGMYMTMMLAFYRVDSKLYSFIDMLRSANNLSLRAEKIKGFFELKSEIETFEKTQTMLPLSEDKFSIQINNVTFAYDNGNPILSGINMDIKPGEKIAIVGENGVGKSTLIKLLLRLYDVNDGEILINGKAIQKYDLHELRNCIGVAFQNPNIYAMSFSENILLYGENSIPLEHLINQLGLLSIFNTTDPEYNIELTREFSNDGLVLSGGEMQKVALARVMCKNFGLLLLDEPSSALDPIAEHKMAELILDAANKTTTIIVAHRLSTIRNADKIMLIDGGKISESGTHDELMALHGKYYEMFTKQAENYIN